MTHRQKLHTAQDKNTTLMIEFSFLCILINKTNTRHTKVEPQFSSNNQIHHEANLNSYYASKPEKGIQLVLIGA